MDFKDMTSGAAQEWIRREVVDKEVMCNVGTLITALMESGHADGEEIREEFMDGASYYRADTPDGEEEFRTLEALETAIEEAEALVDSLEDAEPDMPPGHERKLADARARLEALETARDDGPEYDDIFEYWAVSDQLARRLQERGEAVVDVGLLHVWGRCTTGQAILLDSVIVDIARELYEARRQYQSATVDVLIREVTPHDELTAPRMQTVGANRHVLERNDSEEIRSHLAGLMSEAGERYLHFRARSLEDAPIIAAV